MLENVPCITVANGYAALDEMASPTIPLNTSELIGKICVGVQTGAQVTFGRRFRVVDSGSDDCDEVVECVSQDIRVNQVFCAALNMKQGPAGVKTSKHPQARAVAECILQAAYEGSYLAAIDSRSPKLFLTMLGGGAFGNPFSVIFREIVKAHLKYGIDDRPNGALREVVLVLYKRPDELQSFVDILNQNNIPFECRVYNNGVLHY